MGTEMECYSNRHSIRPISLGPGTPWPNRAETAIRLFKKQVSLMLISLKGDPLLANITYKQVLRQACISRNTMVTHGGVTPVEVAFGRRPANITAIENMTPGQLKAPAPSYAKSFLRQNNVMTFEETLLVNSNSVMDHSFRETRFTIGLKIIQDKIGWFPRRKMD